MRSLKTQNLHHWVIGPSLILSKRRSLLLGFIKNAYSMGLQAGTAFRAYPLSPSCFPTVRYVPTHTRFLFLFSYPFYIFSVFFNTREKSIAYKTLVDVQAIASTCHRTVTRCVAEREVARCKVWCYCIDPLQVPGLFLLQVRHMVGALLAVGAGNLDPSVIAQKLEIGSKEVPGDNPDY